MKFIGNFLSYIIGGAVIIALISSVFGISEEVLINILVFGILCWLVYEVCYKFFYKGLIQPLFNTAGKLVGADYNSRVIKKLKEFDELQQITIADEPEYAMNKNERHILSVNATMGEYKRNGNVGYGMITGRIKLAPGIYGRVGGGKYAMSKSWVFDLPGRIHMTTDGFLFDGNTKNVFLKWSDIINMSIDNNALYIDRKRGSDLMFKLANNPKEEYMASALAYSMGAVKQL